MYDLYGRKMETKRITVRDIIDAIRKNGYPQAFGEFFMTEGFRTEPLPLTREENVPIHFGAACAMGQAAVNLGVRAPDIYNLLVSIDIDIDTDEAAQLAEVVGNLNDKQKTPLPEIANIIEYMLPDVDLEMSAEMVVQNYNFVGAKEGNP